MAELEELIKRLLLVERARFFADVPGALALLNMYNRDDAKDVTTVISTSLSAGQELVVSSPVPVDYVSLTVFAQVWVSTGQALSLEVLRDEQSFFSDAGVVAGQYDFSYWLPCLNRWTFRVVNLTASDVGGYLHLAGYNLRKPLWDKLKPTLQKLGQALHESGDIGGNR